MCEIKHLEPIFQYSHCVGYLVHSSQPKPNIRTMSFSRLIKQNQFNFILNRMLHTITSLSFKILPNEKSKQSLFGGKLIKRFFSIYFCSFAFKFMKFNQSFNTHATYLLQRISFFFFSNFLTCSWNALTVCMRSTNKNFHSHNSSPISIRNKNLNI